MTIVGLSNGHIVAADRVIDEAAFVIANDRIVEIRTSADRADLVIDLDGGWLVPGFIDTQVNGGGGVLLNDEPTLDGIAAIGAAHAAFGTTGFLPTLISADAVTIARALDAIDEALNAKVPGLIGLHIEGPFINPKRRGIHAEERLCRLSSAALDLLTRPRRGKIVLTLAPELADPEDIAKLVASGLILSAGHTDSTQEEAERGFAAGITGVTHLFNAMPPLHHRAPGLVGAALDNEGVWCGLIADGVHVAPAMLRVALRSKGADKIMLVTDAMPPVGNGGKPFRLDGRKIYVHDGVCTDAAGTLAGSGLNMAMAVRGMVEFGGADVPTAARMAAATPAAFLGLTDDYGSVEAGKRADFVVLDAALHPLQTWIGGRRAA